MQQTMSTGGDERGAFRDRGQRARRVPDQPVSDGNSRYFRTSGGPGGGTGRRAGSWCARSPRRPRPWRCAGAGCPGGRGPSCACRRTRCRRGASPAQAASRAAVANRAMSPPVPAMMTSAVRCPIPGMVTSRAVRAADGAAAPATRAPRPGDLGGEVVAGVQVQPAHLAVARGEPAVAGHRQLPGLAAQHAQGQPGQPGRVPLPGDQRPRSSPARTCPACHWPPRPVLIPASSSTMASRCPSPVRCPVSFLRYLVRCRSAATRAPGMKPGRSSPCSCSPAIR